MSMSSGDADLMTLLASLDAGVVLFEPVVSHSDSVLDARVVWATTRSASVWGDGPGALASEVCPDFDEWLAAANGAWRGVPVRRLIEADHGRRGWTRAVSTVSRVGDHLSEVTVDRSADQELIDRLAALDRHYRDVLTELPLTVIASRFGLGNVEFISPNAAELTGRPFAELTRIADWSTFIHPDDLHLADSVRRVVAHGGDLDVVGRLVRPDGDDRWVQVRAVSDRADLDGERRFVIAMLDITDQRALQQQAEQSDRLETLARAAGSFAHEFSSLLQIAAGNLERLQRQTDEPSAPIEQSLEALQRAGGLVNGLMSFASSRPGVIEPVSIPALCQRMHMVLRERLPASAEMTIVLAEDLPLVMISAEALGVVMMHVVDNAAASLGVNGLVHVSVTERTDAHCHLQHATTRQRWVCITVEDNGCGITQDRLRRVWEPFHTSRSGADSRGAGLGLSIVHGVVHQFDGHATIDSRDGRGTTVRLFLPVSED